MIPKIVSDTRSIIESDPISSSSKQLIINHGPINYKTSQMVFNTYNIKQNLLNNRTIGVNPATTLAYPCLGPSRLYEHTNAQIVISGIK